MDSAIKTVYQLQKESWYINWHAKNVESASKKSKDNIFDKWLLFFRNIPQDILVLVFRELYFLVIEYEEMIACINFCKNSKKYFYVSDSSPQNLYIYISHFSDKYPTEIYKCSWLLKKCLRDTGTSLDDFVGEYGHNVFHGITGEYCKQIPLSINIVKIFLEAESFPKIICDLLNSCAYCSGSPIDRTKYGDGKNIEVSELLQKYIDKYGNFDKLNSQEFILKDSKY